MLNWSKISRTANAIALVSFAGIIALTYFPLGDSELSFWIMLALFLVFAAAALFRFLRGILEDLGITRE